MILIKANNSLYCVNNPQQTSFKGKEAKISDEVLNALIIYKDGFFEINNKLRGVRKDKLTPEEEKYIKGVLAAPKRTLNEDTFVFRGIGDTYCFNPLKMLKVGEIFHEKGFTALSPLERIAKEFRFSVGVIAKILMPKGSKYIDVDSLLIENIDRLPEYHRQFYKIAENPCHEWILPPETDYYVKSYSNKGSIFDPAMENCSEKKDPQNLGKFDFIYIPDYTPINPVR